MGRHPYGDHRACGNGRAEDEAEDAARCHRDDGRPQRRQFGRERHRHRRPRPGRADAGRQVEQDSHESIEGAGRRRRLELRDDRLRTQARRERERAGQAGAGGELRRRREDLPGAVPRDRGGDVGRQPYRYRGEARRDRAAHDAQDPTWSHGDDRFPECRELFRERQRDRRRGSRRADSGRTMEPDGDPRFARGRRRHREVVLEHSCRPHGRHGLERSEREPAGAAAPDP